MTAPSAWLIEDVRVDELVERARHGDRDAFGRVWLSQGEEHQHEIAAAT